jgi:DNA-binding NtrC family response regulator
MILDGCGVLIVEDEAMVAIMLEDLLRELGCRAIGPASRVETALSCVEAMEFDLAILDVNLNGEMSYPVADALESHKLPFLFATGYGSASIPEKYRQYAVLQKPFLKQELMDALVKVLQAAAEKT